MLQRALIVGQTPYLLRPIVSLLDRADFEVEVLFYGAPFKNKIAIRSLQFIADESAFLGALALAAKQSFDLIIISDDLTLHQILYSDLSETAKDALLPVCSKEYWGHLCSKIGLAHYLHKAGLVQPSYRVCENANDLNEHAQQLGFPLMLKIDYSGGGLGVTQCDTLLDIHQAQQRSLSYPLLMQEKITGAILDLSGIFYRGKLLFFSHSEMTHCLGHEFGPSIARTYHRRHRIDPAIESELKDLGVALGLHGLINITAIQSMENGKRYYIEADGRPNVWLNFPRYLDDDPAQALQDFFSNPHIYSIKSKGSTLQNEPAVIPYALRMKPYEIMFNRYQVWGYLGEFSKEEIISHCLHPITLTLDSYWNSRVKLTTDLILPLKQYGYRRLIHVFESTITRTIKPYIPAKLWSPISYAYKKIKELRIN